MDKMPGLGLVNRECNRTTSNDYQSSGGKTVPVTTGIHHITAFVNDVQATVDFYAGVLGLRLVKQSVNFDAPEIHHLYFGNESGSPGTIISFFPQEDARQGTLGGGQVGITVYAVPKDSLIFWRKRLKHFQIEVMEATRFDEKYITFTDNSGLIIELVEREQGPNSWWSLSSVPVEFAIKGFAGALLFSSNSKSTERVLVNLLGLRKIAAEEGLIRFKADGELGNVIDLNAENILVGEGGAGTVHHIAWRAKDYAELEAWGSLIETSEMQSAKIVDRQFYKAMYFREPGNILFQIATDLPGFQCDQRIEDLGGRLDLPEQLESQRAVIEKKLKPFVVRALD